MGDNCKSTINLVKHYDLKLNAQGRFIWFTFKFKEVNILGLAEVAVAIGQGPQVAQGEQPMQITLQKQADEENVMGVSGQKRSHDDNYEAVSKHCRGDLPARGSLQGL